jgi:hypothetical protein
LKKQLKQEKFKIIEKTKMLAPIPIKNKFETETKIDLMNFSKA